MLSHSTQQIWSYGMHTPIYCRLTYLLTLTLEKLSNAEFHDIIILWNTMENMISMIYCVIMMKHNYSSVLATPAFPIRLPGCSYMKNNNNIQTLN